MYEVPERRIMTKAQEKACERYREAIEKSVEADEEYGRYAREKDGVAIERERLRERAKERDEDEKAAKAEYERAFEGERNALSADEFRHMTVERMSAREYDL